MAPSSPYSALRQKALARPDLPLLLAPASAALPYAPDGFRFSYGAIHDACLALRDRFAAAGYTAGDRVALLLENRPEFFVHWLALNALGVSIVPINPDMRAEELRFQLEVSGARLVVALAEHDALVTGGLTADAVAVHPGDPLPQAAPQMLAGTTAGDPDCECALLFTSGSSGKPKACILSNRYFMTLADWYVTQGGIAEMGEDCEIALTPLPFFHMNALGCTAVGMMVKGGAIVPLDRFSARRWWATVADSGATIVHCLGVIPAILLQLPEDPAERLHKARFALGPGVDARHKQVFEARYGLPIVEAWAMTETGGAAVTTTARDDYEAGRRCIGRARDSMDYRIVDDAGQDVPLGEPGELLVRAKGDDPRRGFFSGYLGDPTATEEAWAGGWFHTGDLVHGDQGGLLYFFDRKKSVVRRSGENIAVLEVEAVLNRDPAIEAVAVAPAPDDLRGEEVFAFVVLSGEARTRDRDTLAGEILQQAAQSLSYHKLPGYIAFIDALPVGSTQKLQRGVLKSEAARLLTEGGMLDLRQDKAAIRKADKPAAAGG
ncbi:AMP-binding protein [Rhizobium halophytocola]|uniref:Acyl-CoA synthetase (AMP-forming)/AMP-acid ligase II n=1 Tax=Rhizobium halophytocola TaxID=735519 RepID=A0ABS4DV93_9HYPH|nr:AMP-binding protein [Rhizobium halophytocola]MBP1849606.1 acyl-CoA synthetase (AMP-forming)/AMP-acid ligase II [Rhizobium halophytocola]